jgi:AbiTii
LGPFSSEVVDTIQQVDFRDGIAKAVSFVTNGGRIHRPDLIFEIQGTMYPQMNCSGIWLEISGANFEQFVSAVKSRILDFVLEIEAESPDAGEAPLKSQPVPMEKLQPLVNNFFGAVGNIAQSSKHFSQVAKVGIQQADLVRLVAELTDHLDELRLDASQKQKAKAQVDTLRAQHLYSREEASW